MGNDIETTNKGALAVLVAVVVGVFAAAIQANVIAVTELLRTARVITSPILMNPYVSGLVCSFVGIYIVYRYQLHRAKRALRNDFRCGEVMNDLRLGIDSYHRLLNEMPRPALEYLRLSNEPFRYEWEQRGKFAEALYDDYQNRWQSYAFVCEVLLFENNRILIESMRASLFFNVNPEALMIINNIENRVPTLKRKWKEIGAHNAENIESAGGSVVAESIAEKAVRIYECIQDMGFLVSYCQDALAYLGYNPEIQDIASKNIASQYSIAQYNALPKKSQRKLAKRAMRKARRTFAIEYKHIDMTLAIVSFLTIIAMIVFALTSYCCRAI